MEDWVLKGTKLITNTKEHERLTLGVTSLEYALVGVPEAVPGGTQLSEEHTVIS